MHSAAHAYAATAQKTANPRELESQLLLRAAAKLYAVQSGDTQDSREITSAFRYNRRLWTVFASAMRRDDNPLPAPVRENMLNLAAFVIGNSIKMEINPEHGALKTLININRQVAAGLRGSGEEAEATPVGQA